MTDNKKPVKLCLNMIVKNESKIIQRLLESVYTILDAYCICDTGSTDNTIEIIEKFFQSKQIPGKVIREPFRNFEYNRSFALNACNDMDVDFILLMDADMILWKNPKITPDKFKQLLSTHDSYFMFQGSENMYYKNTRIVRNQSNVCYKCVTHEYVQLPEGFTQGVLVKEIVFIQDIGDGGAKSDKFTRDVRLLKNGLKDEPNNERYLFYLANSLKDLSHTQNQQIENQMENLKTSTKELGHLFQGNTSALGLLKNIDVVRENLEKSRVSSREKLLYEAIEYYEKRIKAGGFWEEVWYSHYNIGHAYFHLGEIEKALYYFQKSFIQYPQRVENIYEIVKYYRLTGQNDLAVHFYLMGKKSLENFKSRDYLFIQRDIYDYKLDFEMSIIGYYMNPTNIDLQLLSMGILNQMRQIEGNVSQNVLSNYKFYTEALVDRDTNAWNKKSLGSLLCNLGSSFSTTLESGFSSSTPTYVKVGPEEIHALVRYVNYHIDENGGYVQNSTIETRNAVGKIVYDYNKEDWVISNDCLLQYNTQYDGVYVGLEDVRFHYHAHNDTIYYTANRGLGHSHMVVEHGIYNRTFNKTENSQLLTIDGQTNIEKNWTMFSYGEDLSSIYMVYKWHPMIIGKVEDNRVVITKKKETPHIFQYLRGSIGGLVVDDEMWFLCHCVSYEERRYYYHIMVMLNKKTLEVIRISKLFTFEKEKVEYCSGMDRIGDDIRFSYSTMDNTTKVVSVPMSYF